MGRPTDAAALRTLVQLFVREFGLLAESETPCGQPLHTSHAHALMILRQVGAEGLHQAALSRALGIDKSNTSRLVRQLVESGHAAIGADEDARMKRVRLTARGVRLAETVDEASRQRFNHVLAAIDPSDRRRVMDGL